jgi:HAD superfamily phosphatase
MTRENGADGRIWIRQHVAPPAPIDTVIFDVDGVLWDTGDSFDTAVRETVDYFLRRYLGGENPYPVTTEELRIFRRAGGLNNDWDMTYTLIATRLAGRADIEQLAAESQGRGRPWAGSLLSGEPAVDYDTVVRIFNEIYWGSADFQRAYNEAPGYLADAPGCWHRETQLLPPTLIDDLRAAGVRHLGVATGRNQIELSTVLESSGLHQHIPDDAIITGDVLAKPDGRVLDRILANLAQLAASAGQAPPGAALFLGDTKDDLDAVLNYRKVTGEKARWIGAVAVVQPEEASFFQQAGSDAIIDHVALLPDLIDRVNVNRK